MPTVDLSDLAAPAFPLVKGQQGYVAVATGADVIKQDLQQLLTTQPGSRVMRPRFGCDLATLAFEPNDDILRALAKRNIKAAIDEWEQRVTVQDVTITVDDTFHLARFSVRYQIRSTQQIDTVDGEIQRSA
jgi:uncharacterized protein